MFNRRDLGAKIQHIALILFVLSLLLLDIGILVLFIRGIASSFFTEYYLHFIPWLLVLALFAWIAFIFTSAFGAITTYAEIKTERLQKESPQSFPIPSVSHCTGCGTPITSKIAFCPNCGTPTVKG